MARQKKGNGSTIDGNIKLNRHDFLLTLGTGVEFYTTYFKFGIEAKMSYGLTNILAHEDDIYSGTIDRLNSKLFLLSFTFE